MSAKPPKSSQDEQDGLPKVGDERLVELGAALREKYAQIAQEPLPERLQAMIDAMKAAEKKAREED